MKSKNLTDIGKICSACGIDKPLSEFGKLSKTRDWLKAKCKKCCNKIDGKRRKERYALDDGYREKARLRAKAYRDGTIKLLPKKPVVDHAIKAAAWQLKCNYMALQKIYDNLYEKQNGCCAICNLPASGLRNRLCIDHNHNTNKVRGLLCTGCNAGIGSLRDSAELCSVAAEYLRMSKADK